MNNGISIGHNIDKALVEAVTKGICALFDSAAKNRVEQRTLRHAIDSLAKAFHISGTTLSSVSLNGDKTVNT